MQSLQFLILFLFGLLYITRPLYQRGNNRNLSIAKILITVHDTTAEDRALDELFKLPEVKRKEMLIDSLTKHKKGVSMIVLGRPTEKSPFFFIQAGYNNEIRFEPYYTFSVNKNTMAIKVEDTMTGEFYTLKEWRRRNRN